MICAACVWHFVFKCSAAAIATTKTATTIRITITAEAATTLFSVGVQQACNINGYIDHSINHFSLLHFKILHCISPPSLLLLLPLCAPCVLCLCVCLSVCLSLCCARNPFSAVPLFPINKQTNRRPIYIYHTIYRETTYTHTYTIYRIGLSWAGLG